MPTTLRFFALRFELLQSLYLYQATKHQNGRPQVPQIRRRAPGRAHRPARGCRGYTIVGFDPAGYRMELS